MDIIEKLKLRRAQLTYKFPYKKNKINIISFLRPTYGNLGDQAIAQAEKNFFENEFSNYNFVEIPDFVNRWAIIRLKRKIQRKDIITLPGGGNFGNLYPEIEKDRRKVIEAFPNNKIIMFPQSIYFDNNEFQKQTIKIISSHNDITLCARDSMSYKKMKEIFKKSNVNILKIPDIVLYLNDVTQKDVFRENKVLFVLRNDIERSLSSKKIDYIKDIVNDLDLKMEFSDNVIDRYIKVSDRNNILKKRLEKFQSSKLIITDRLHGMIFAFITRTPCIVFDNNNGKISSEYKDWLKDYGFIKYIDSSNLSIEKRDLEYLINYKINDCKFDISNYSSLINLIKNKSGQNE